MKKLIFIVIILVAGFFAYEFLKPKPKTEYITQKAVRGDLAKKVEASGEIFATELVDVGAQVSGQIKKLYVRLGDSVKQGDMIAEIDDETQKNNVENKRAQLLIYEAQLESAKVAYDVAKSQFERENSLFKANATSKQNYENAKNAMASAKAKIGELNAQINQAKIALDTALIDLGYTKILAPRNGVVVSVPVEEGQTINANQTTPTIVYIADLSSVKLKMQIAEGDITKIKVGTKVEYEILSDDKKFQAVVSSIDPGLTTLSDGKYTTTSTSSTSSTSAVYYYAQSIVDNKDGILRIGMTTQNSLLIDEAKDAIIVPSIAVKKDGKKHFVQILSENSPKKVEVKVGISDGVNTQILSGVSENDEIITAQGSSEEIAKMVEKAKF